MIAGYKLRITGGSLFNQITDVGLVYSHIFTGLDPSTEYAVDLASYDAEDVQSDWTPLEYATTEAAPEMTVVIDGDGSVLVDDEGSAITVII